MPDTANATNSLPDPADVLWWHAYSGMAPNMAVDQDGNPADVFHFVVFGESTKIPEDVPRTVHEDDHDLDYVMSWDHDPTEAETDAVKPPEFRQQH